MPRRLRADASDTNTRKASDKESSLDLRATALFITKFTARDLDILRGWLVARGDYKLAGAAADCPENQVYNVVRKVKEVAGSFLMGGFSGIESRFDHRYLFRLLESVAKKKADKRLLGEFRKDPGGTAERFLREGDRGISAADWRVKEKRLQDSLSCHEYSR